MLFERFAGFIFMVLMLVIVSISLAKLVVNHDQTLKGIQESYQLRLLDR